MGDFREVDWTDIYGEVREAILDNAPEPWGKRLSCDSLWTRTMLMISCGSDQGWGSAFPSIWGV